MSFVGFLLEKIRGGYIDKIPTVYEAESEWLFWNFDQTVWLSIIFAVSLSFLVTESWL